MQRNRIDDLVYKHGTHGPGYLSRGPLCDVGVIVLRPGDDYRNHYHARSENSFCTIEGEVTLWSDCRERFTLRAGDFHRCDPLEMHYFRNEGEVVWRALFVRVPFDPSDTIEVPWKPGQPAPPLIARPAPAPPLRTDGE
jgi:mannose-6-phosphate isomerase-like protein (cupin superfamily)